MGLPIFPTVFTFCFAVFKIFSIILQVVDLPLVPVTEIINDFLLSSKNISRSVIILFVFFFKYFLSLHLLILIPGLITIKSIPFFLNQNFLTGKFNFCFLSYVIIIIPTIYFCF